LRIHTITELSRRAPHIAREAENGEVCIISRHGKPVALITPISDEMLEELQLRMSLKEGEPLWEALQEAAAAQAGKAKLKAAKQFAKERELGD